MNKACIAIALALVLSACGGRPLQTGEQVGIAGFVLDVVTAGIPFEPTEIRRFDTTTLAAFDPTVPLLDVIAPSGFGVGFDPSSRQSEPGFETIVTFTGPSPTNNTTCTITHRINTATEAQEIAVDCPPVSPAAKP